MKTIIASTIAATAMFACAEPFGAAEKAVLRDIARQAEAKMKEAAALEGKAVTLLPVHGDEDGYMERLLIGAVVSSGRTGVISNDEKNDERFKRILADIKWDAAQLRLSSVDPSTIDELGRLKSTQILMEARLDLTRATTNEYGEAKGASAELNLLAYAVATKQYVWNANIVKEPEAPPPPPELPKQIASAAVAPLHVAVETKADKDAERVSGLVETSVRGMLAQLGYIVDGNRKPDVVVSLETSRETFDHTGGWFVYDGTLKIKANVPGAEARLLGETSIAGRGARGLGETQADRNLSDALGEQAMGWLKRTLKSDAVGFEALVFSVYTLDAAHAEKIRAAAAAMDGTRVATTEAADEANGWTTFRAVYEKAKFPGGFAAMLFAANPELFK